MMRKVVQYWLQVHIQVKEIDETVNKACEKINSQIIILLVVLNFLLNVIHQAFLKYLTI
jgi:hypothetical protein